MPAHAEQPLGILKIFDQFVTSNAAASKCIKPDDDTLTKFLVNFQMISIYTSQELSKEYPTRSKEQINNAIKQKINLITEQVNKIIEEKGCDDPDVKELLKRFNVQANWQPLK